MTRFIFAIALLGACGDDGLGSLRVDLRTDLVPVLELEEVTIAVDGEGLQTYVPAAGSTVLSGTAVASFRGLVDGRHQGVMRLFGAMGVRIGERRFAVDVVGDTVMTLVFTRSCRSVRCPGADPAATACLNGSCVDPECSDERPELCGESRCTSRDECPPSTDPCASAECSDGACLLAPNPGACEAGEVCDPDEGCVEFVVPDAGDADAGADATEPDAGCVQDAPCDAGPCATDGRSVCDGEMLVRCEATALRPRGTTCRVADGVCDEPETCSGTVPLCPPDRFRSSGVCRPVAGPCDVEDSCDGASADCPTDRFERPTVMCRAADGPCDVDDNCTGDEASCPNEFRDDSFVCRPATGTCDVAERCSGEASDCPFDRFESPATVCREAVDSFCDRDDRCSGGPECQEDITVPNGTPCPGEGSATCMSGVCVDPG